MTASKPAARRKPPRRAASPVDPRVYDAEVVEPIPTVPVRRSAVVASRRSVVPSSSSVFSTWLASKHEKTMLNYRGGLGDFAGWYMADLQEEDDAGEPVGGHRVPIETIGLALEGFMASTKQGGHETALRYRNWLQNTRKLAPNTINHKLAALRSYIKLANEVDACAWTLTLEGFESENVRDVRGPGPTGYATLVAGAKAKIAAAEAAGDERSVRCWIRNLALVRLYHDAGLRRFEPLTIDYPVDVELRRGGESRIRLRRKKRRAKAWFDLGSKRAVQAVQDWIAVRGTDPGPLFTSMHLGHVGKRLTTTAINKMLVILGDSVDIKVATHGLRHTAATTLLDKTNGNLHAVSEFLGHTGTGVVKKYDDLRQQQAKKMGMLLDDD